MGSPPHRLHPGGSARQRLEPSRGYGSELLRRAEELDMGEQHLFAAWQLAAWARDLGDDERDALAELVLGVFAAVGRGSTRYALSADERALLARAPEIAGPPGARRPLVVEHRREDHPADGHGSHGHVALERHVRAETSLARALAALVAAPPPWPAEAAACDAAVAAVRQAPWPLSQEQQAAVRAALGRRLTVITGGPGTGKTSILLALLRALVRLGVRPSEIALAAPTGRAAFRMDETLRAGLGDLAASAPEDRALAEACPPAETLHRLLGYSSSQGVFRLHEGNPIGARVVVVDEASMIDLGLMERLVRALGDASLVLLGDANQLPSVEAGSVLRDLGGLAVTLSHSFRMKSDDPDGGRVLATARAVHAGDAVGALRLAVRRAGPADVAWKGVELCAPSSRDAVLAHLVERVVGAGELRRLAAAPFTWQGGRFDEDDVARLRALAAAWASTRVLCVTRGMSRPTGADAVNAALHRLAAGSAAGFFAGSSPGFAPGEPVMVTRNDYERRLWNGDQGVVVRLRSPRGAPRLVAVFPRPDEGAATAEREPFAVWEVDDLRDSLTRAFALTVHKAQGSEFDNVVLLLPDEPIPLLTREVVYTAMTRSRRGALIVGDESVLAAAIARPVERLTGLAGRLGV